MDKQLVIAVGLNRGHRRGFLWPRDENLKCPIRWTREDIENISSRRQLALCIDGHF